MQFDDRLATVLRHRASGTRAARTQYRQLLDLLGARRGGSDQQLLAAAWLRLGALGETIPATERAAMIDEPGLRFRNPELAAHLAGEEPEVAAAALGRVQLSETDWETLIPSLPVRARGFLRLRRDLPAKATRLLEQLGIHDRGLPEPADAKDQRNVVPVGRVAANDSEPNATESGAALKSPQAIGAIVERIKAYKRARARPGGDAGAPRLPLGENRDTERPPLLGFSVTTDADGRIDWAEPEVAPMLFGTLIAQGNAGIVMRRRQPLRSEEVELSGAPAIAGRWVVDAAPRFTGSDGRFYGYAGKFRRPAAERDAGAHATAQGETGRIREVLHELRTPVNAIQGFAEVIQQQVFGTVPNEYRAHAANIASDAARMLAGFDELDRLAKLETGAISLEEGQCDFAALVAGQVAQLETAIQARMAGFDADIDPGLAVVPLIAADGQTMTWRILATLAGHLGAGEICELTLVKTGSRLILEASLPVIFADQEDIFSSTLRPKTGAVSAGMFGAGFAMRLARAEARTVNGDLTHVEDLLRLELPLLTGTDSKPSDEQGRRV